jgi:hypothetical protein
MPTPIITYIKTFLAVLAGINAQGGFPECAVQCSLASIESSICDKTDIKCLCSDKPSWTEVMSCVASKCNENDQAKSLEVAQKICSGAGVEIDI